MISNIRWKVRRY